MESLVGYGSDDDIPDKRYSNADLQEQEQRDSKGRERSEMDNYDNIQMDMSEDSNSASVESGGGNPDSHFEHPEESWKKRNEEKQHPGNYRAQKSYNRDEKQHSNTVSNHPENLHEDSKFYPAHRDDVKTSVNNFSGSSNAVGDSDRRMSRAQRDEDRSYEEDRGHRRLEAEDKYDNSKKNLQGDRRLEEDKHDDKHNYHPEGKISENKPREKQESKPDNGRNPRLEKHDDNNKSDRDDRRSATDKRDSKYKPLDRSERRSSVEKRDKHKSRPDDHDEKNSKRSTSRDKTSDNKRTSHDRDQRKSGRSRSREKAGGDVTRTSREREDKRPRRSKSREKSSQTKRASYERDEKKSIRSGSRDRRSEHRRDGKRGSGWPDKRDDDRLKDRRHGKDRSRSPARTSADKRKSRSPSHGGSRSSPANERRGPSPKRFKRSPDRRRGSRERNMGGGRTQFEKKPSKLSILERLGITLPNVSDLQGAVTPQQLVQRSMALQVQQVKSTTGIELPSYYNPAAMNPARYAEQIQKRRLLWGNKGDGASAKPAEAAAPVPAPPAVGANKWEGTTFKSDHDGMMTAKFKRLMGIKNQDSSGGEGSSGTGNKPAEGNEIIKKQEEMFNSMEMQYEVARVATHTHRGLGLGFGTFQYPR